MSTDQEIDDIIARYEAAVPKCNLLKENKFKIEVKRDSYRADLKKVMDDAKAAGYDPNKIREEVQRAKEVALVKIEVFETEIAECEKIMKPMLKELQGAGG